VVTEVPLLVKGRGGTSLSILSMTDLNLPQILWNNKRSKTCGTRHAEFQGALVITSTNGTDINKKSDQVNRKSD
jgi:hypothetical protein